MKEFVDKLIGRLEEAKDRANRHYNYGDEIAYSYSIQIVKELAENHKSKVMINEQYCWQTCGATEHCKECNRLSNGSIDYYENYDFMVNEHNNSFCEWRLCDEDSNVYDTSCRNPHILLEGTPIDNDYKFCPHCGKKIKVVE